MTAITRKLERLDAALYAIMSDAALGMRACKDGEPLAAIAVRFATIRRLAKEATRMADDDETQTAPGDAPGPEVTRPAVSSSRPPEETITIFFHSRADTGEHLGLEWSHPPSSRLDIVGMHTDHSIDLLLDALDDPWSSLSEDIAGRLDNNWPAWSDRAVRFVVGWGDGYFVERCELDETPPAPAEDEESAAETTPDRDASPDSAVADCAGAPGGSAAVSAFEAWLLGLSIEPGDDYHCAAAAFREMSEEIEKLKAIGICECGHGTVWHTLKGSACSACDCAGYAEVRDPRDEEIERLKSMPYGGHLKKLQDRAEKAERERDDLRVQRKRYEGALADAGDIPASNVEAGIRLLTQQRDGAQRESRAARDGWGEAESVNDSLKVEVERLRDEWMKALAERDEARAALVPDEEESGE